MTASPITTSVARQFLTEQARDAWQPDAGIITYADLVTPVGATQVSVGLVGANRVDAGGRWQGPLDEDEAELQFELVTEGGEWRIDSLPDAMIVPDNWFQDRYVQMNLHFFDPTGRVLVPEPVYVPRGGQAATSLVRGLLRGPDSELAGVTQSFVPQGLSLDVLVPEPVDGFAEVLLTGDVAAVDPATSELLVAQFAWTLRQVPNLTRFRLSLNGTPLGASGTAADIAVSRGEPYDPAVPEGWSDAFGIADGDLVTVSSRGLSAVEGERKSATSEWRSFAVDLSAGRVASVDATGQRVDVMPLNGSLAPVRAIQGLTCSSRPGTTARRCGRSTGAPRAPSSGRCRAGVPPRCRCPVSPGSGYGTSSSPETDRGWSRSLPARVETEWSQRGSPATEDASVPWPRP
nr:GerMN domain-containing protein [Nocardioides alcanivorans]